MMRNARKYIIAVIVIVLGITFLGPETYAANRANIAVETDSLYTITNKEKEKLLYNYETDGDFFTGTMKTYFQDGSLGDNDKRWSIFHDEFTGIEYWLDRSGVVVNDSDEFRFTYVPEEDIDDDDSGDDSGMGLSILMTSKKHPYVHVETALSQEIIVGKKSIEVTAYEGEYCQYAIDYRKSKKGTNYAVDGYTNSKVVFK